MSNTNWNEKEINELEDFLSNKILLPGTENYLRFRNGWAATNNQPAIICLCETAEDVQAAVVLAGKKNIPLSVRGGGHDWQARSSVHGGLVIDLSKMRHIDVDATTKTAYVEGGVTSTEIAEAADPFDLIPVVGNSGAVGIVGFTIGGGYGVTSPKHGLGADNLLSANVVLADGSLVTASKTENPDLLWALCGGGGNFGVVTSMRIRLHDNPTLVAGFMMFPLEEAETIIQGYNKIMQSSPSDNFYASAVMLTGPNGSPLLFFSPVWAGEPEEGKRLIDSIRELGHPVKENIGEMRLKDFLALLTASLVNGRSYHIKTRWIETITPEITALILKSAADRTSPYSKIAIFHMHGVATRTLLPETSFGLRKDHHVVNVLAEWEPEDVANAETHRKWANELAETLGQYALPGGYANLLGSEEHEQIAHSYGSNLPRLQSIKKIYDPDEVFSAIPLPR